MNRFEQYLSDYQSELKAADNTVGALVAFTGEQLARAIPRLAQATPDEMPAAARYLLAVAGDHCLYLSGEGLNDQAAATMISVLMLLLNRKANPETFKAEYQGALVDCVAPSLLAAQDAAQQADRFAADHWVAIALQQTALAAVTARTFALPRPDGAPGDCLDQVFYIADNEPRVPSQWHGQPITAFTGIDILTDSTARLNAMGLL